MLGSQIHQKVDLISFGGFFWDHFVFKMSQNIQNMQGYEQADAKANAKANEESKTSSGGGGSSSSSSRTVLRTQTSRSGALDRGPSMQQMDDAIADAGLDDDEDFAEESETLRLNVNVFDVINRVACDGLTRMFDSTEQTKDARRILRYITSKPPDEVFGITSDIINGASSVGTGTSPQVERVNASLQRHTVNTSKGAVGMNVSCRQIAENLNLVEITKGKGGLLQYAEALLSCDVALKAALK